MAYQQSSRLALRSSMVFLWLTSVLSVALSFHLESALHPLLQDYLQVEYASATTRRDETLDYVGGATATLFLIASIGIFFYKTWAKLPFIITAVVGYLVTPFYGPFVETGLVVTLDHLSVMCEGAAIALILFTDVLQKEKALI